ncbi:transposase [Thioclava kandeliae]|uniref:transposase n=1 Tax=Thioclava kandeliae TaxID=3070818 RepID=UPI003D9DD38D
MPPAGIITAQIPYRLSGLTLNLISDSISIRFRGDGEWILHEHGATRRREWHKIHLELDTATGNIRTIEFTSSRQGNSPVLPLSKIPADGQIETVVADGAYNTRRCHAAILKHRAELIIPIRRNDRS